MHKWLYSRRAVLKTDITYIQYRSKYLSFRSQSKTCSFYQVLLETKKKKRTCLRYFISPCSYPRRLNIYGVVVCWSIRNKSDRLDMNLFQISKLVVASPLILYSACWSHQTCGTHLEYRLLLICCLFLLYFISFWFFPICCCYHKEMKTCKKYYTKKMLGVWKFFI